MNQAACFGRLTGNDEVFRDDFFAGGDALCHRLLFGFQIGNALRLKLAILGIVTRTTTNLHNFARHVDHRLRAHRHGMTRVGVPNHRIEDHTHRKRVDVRRIGLRLILSRNKTRHQKNADDSRQNAFAGVRTRHRPFRKYWLRAAFPNSASQSLSPCRPSSTSDRA